MKIKDILKPKSEEEILSSIGDLDPDYLLTKSITRSFLPGIKKALEMGADVHAHNDAALRRASEKGHSDIVEFLIKNGADIHSNDEYALRVASYNGHTNIVELLLINGANIHDDEALRLASGNGHLDVIELFNLRMELVKNIKHKIIKII
jgi:hypothetical protein